MSSRRPHYRSGARVEHSRRSRVADIPASCGLGQDAPWLTLRTSSFYPNSGDAFASETTTTFPNPALIDPFPASGAALTNTSFFPVSAWSEDVLQTLNIGSSSTGAGAGRVTFNPFAITRQVDSVSSTLLVMAASGTPFKFVDLLFLKAVGGGANPTTYLGYRFGLTAIKTITWRDDEDGSPSEALTFDFGSLSIGYRQQKPDGSYKPWTIQGWDRVRNVRI